MKMTKKWQDIFPQQTLREVQETIAHWTESHADVQGTTYLVYEKWMRERFSSKVHYEVTRILSLLRQDLCQQYVAKYPDFGLVRDIVCAPVARLLADMAARGCEKYELSMEHMREMLHTWGNNYPFIYDNVTISLPRQKPQHYFMAVYKIWKAVRYHGVNPQSSCFQQLNNKVSIIKPEVAFLWKERATFEPLLRLEYPELMDILYAMMEPYTWSSELLDVLSVGIDSSHIYPFCEAWNTWNGEKYESFTGKLKQSMGWGYATTEKIDWSALMLKSPLLDASPNSEEGYLLL